MEDDNGALYASIGGPRASQILIHSVYVKCPSWEKGGGGGETWEKGKKHIYREEENHLYHYPASFQTEGGVSRIVNKTFLKRLKGHALI